MSNLKLDNIVYPFGDFYIFWLIQIVILLFFIVGFYKDVSTRKKRKPFSIKRGEKTLSLVRKLTTIFITAIIITIFNISSVAEEYNIIIFLIDVFMIVYMGLFSPFYRNKIIHLNNKIEKLEE